MGLDRENPFYSRKKVLLYFPVQKDAVNVSLNREAKCVLIETESLRFVERVRVCRPTVGSRFFGLPQTEDRLLGRL